MVISLVRFHQGYLFNPMIFSKLIGTYPSIPPPLCTLLMCTKNRSPRPVSVYTSPEKLPFPATSVRCVQIIGPSTPYCCTHEQCTNVSCSHCQKYSLSLQSVPPPCGTPHRPGGEMVDTRDLKSLGPKRPCGFDSRPGHERMSFYGILFPLKT